MHYAATGPEPNVVQQLLDHGAHIDAESPNRSTPLMMAAPYGSEASAHLLIDRGAAPKPSNDRTMTAADFARSVGRTALALQLDKLAR
ncbi:MAG: ankyrin repeat domain-containing protein [Burkholderiaceae bacterium]|nr:ankyrin repeat domain-containing protein [Burkholderiaceae bacterium]MDH3460824.1 ankyrin repeat domain-containing protein [Burkholderiaceae bacterium]